MCNRKSEINALVEKKTGFDGSRTLIHGGFCVWCNVGSIFAQDISSESYNVTKVTKVKSRSPLSFRAKSSRNAARFARKGRAFKPRGITRSQSAGSFDPETFGAQDDWTFTSKCHSFVRPDNAAESVNSSADSRPPPAGMPRAMRVSAIGLPFKRSTM